MKEKESEKERERKREREREREIDRERKREKDRGIIIIYHRHQSFKNPGVKMSTPYSYSNFIMFTKIISIYQTIIKRPVSVAFQQANKR